MKQGMVYLVGAGPGDYKLISLKGLECIKLADVVVYDRLVDKHLLGYARENAELVYAGKTSGEHALCQEDINRLLVDKARQGKTIARLKGGDPFVFGRGGEEALALAVAGLNFEIVPGVTSAVAAPAYAGIPVTHRGIAASFAVVTGHEDPDKGESGIRWDKLSQGVDTLVFLMGIENLSSICEKLMEHGKAAGTPAAIIRWGCKPGQQVLVTTVGKAALEAEEQGIKPPAVFIVGDVVTLRQKLAWFEKRLLFGKQILVTRAREQASALTSALEKLGAECLEFPAIKTLPPDSFDGLDQSIAGLADYDWLIFTSVNGVKFFFTRLHLAGKDTRSLSGVKIAAIGASTATKLREFGVLADVIPLEFQAEGIIKALSGRIFSGTRILIPRAAVARDILPQELAKLGARVEIVEAYRTETFEGDNRLAAKFAAGEIDIVTFTSSSTVLGLLAILGPDAPRLLKETKTACIGPITAATCLERGIKPDIIAEEFTVDGLVEAICDYYTGEGKI